MYYDMICYMNNKTPEQVEEYKKYHREYMKKWVKENKEKDRIIHNKYRNKNREKLNKKAAEWRKRNPEKVKAGLLKRDRITRNIWKYPINKEEYKEMVLRQENLCAICKRPEQSMRFKILSIDHDHSSGKVRGLLCGNCNRGLGLFKDNPEILISAADYIRTNAIIEKL